MSSKKPAPSAKVERPSFSVRFDPTEKAALEKAAAAEDRPAAYVLRRIALEWLRQKGFLK